MARLMWYAVGENSMRIRGPNVRSESVLCAPAMDNVSRRERARPEGRWNIDAMRSWR